MHIFRFIALLVGMAFTMSQAMKKIDSGAGKIENKILVGQLIYEIQKKDKSDIVALMEQCTDLNECIDGQNALHVAAKLGKIDVVRQLIKAGMQIDKGAPKLMNASALCLAVYYGHDDVVQELIGEYANLNYSLDKINSTPLHIAAMKGRFKITQMLIDAGAQVNARDNHNCTPLHTVVECGNFDYVQLMPVKKGGNRVSQKQVVIPINVYVAIADLLIRRDPKLLETSPIKGTPLHLAARYCQPAMVSLLIQRGSDLFARRPISATPLHEAVVGFAAEKAKQPQNASQAVNLMQAFICTPSKEVMRAARQKVLPLFFYLKRFGSNDGINVRLSKDIRNLVMQYCLVPYLVDEQIKVLKQLFVTTMKCGAEDWTSCQLATYLVGRSENKDLIALADSVDARKVEQHEKSIYCFLWKLARQRL